MKPYFPALTGVRALAAFLVFFFHYNPFPRAPFNWPQALVAQGQAGVSVFFVLSGFLIAARYHNRVRGTCAWARAYFWHRVARVYPLYLLLTAVTFAAMVGHLLTWYTWPEHASRATKALSLLANLTLTRAFFPDYVMLGVPTAWSLTPEVCFYACAPGLLWFCNHRLRRLVLAALALLGLGAVLSLAELQLPTVGAVMHPLPFVLWNTFFGRCVEFLMGMALTLWHQRRGNRAARPGTTLAGVALVAACVAAMAVVQEVGQPLPPGWSFPRAYVGLNNLVLPFAVAWLFHGLVYERTGLQRLLASPPLQVLGKSSYAFYLLHLGLFSDLLGKVIGVQPLVYFGVFTLAAIGLYYLVEQPAHSYLLRRFVPGEPVALETMPTSAVYIRRS